MTALQQRVGSWSRLNFYEEGTFDSDSGIAAGYSLPLSGAESLQFGQSLLNVPVFKGDRRPFSKVLGPFTVTGNVPLNLEFLTLGRLLVVFFGRGGYSRPGGGTTTLHRFIIPTTAGAIPGSCQFEKVSNEATAVVHRARACRIGSLAYNLGTSGPATYQLSAIGIGDIIASATQLFTPTDDGIIPTTYFNGFVNYKAQTAIADLNSLNLTLGGNVTRTEVFANNGIAGSLPTGNVEPKGSIRFMFTMSGNNPGADLNAWNDAIQANEVLIECLISDQPINGPTFPSKYVRFIMPTCRMGAASFVSGGMAGMFMQQNFEAARSIAPGTAAACVAGEAWGTIGGPYNIGAGNQNFAVKIDGGGSINTVLGTGAARTATQVVGDLNGNGSFTAVAVADLFLGNRVRVKSKQSSVVGASSSVQFDTGQANNFAATGGFDNVARAGVTNGEIVMEIYNAKNADY